MFEIIVNGSPHKCASVCSIQQLLAQLEMDQRTGIAVAVNQQVVPQSQWANTTLKQGDQITIITATQGG